MEDITDSKFIINQKIMRLFRKIRPFHLLWSIVRFVIIFGLCFVILYPIIKKVSAAVMEEQDLFDATVVYLAKHYTLDNFKTAWECMNFPEAFKNTLFLSSICSILQLLFCTLVAYGFARFEFPLKKFWFACVMFAMIIPPTTLMLPQFITFRYFDLFGIMKYITGHSVNTINTPIPLILLSITATGYKNGLYIYMLRQLFKGLPKELEEAAYVDGAGRLRTFIRIMLPSAVPMMTTVFLFSFVWQWTDIYYSGLFLNDYKVLSNQLGSLSYNVAASYGSVTGTMSFVSSGYLSMVNNAGVLLCIVPLLILYLVLQKHFVESITRSGIVG
ncbi:multiple sugar transport system permease protein [Anaerotaenia torta]|uniref:carbohydrate ABC transporter permease n=1 Tax=Anaerotaenia torta TaxID=433293 RepID=UPI003D1A18C6